MRTANLILTGSPIYLNESMGKKSNSSASGFLGMCSGSGNTVKKDISMAPKEHEPRMSARRLLLEQEYEDRLEQERIQFEKRQEELRR
jgi:hypothetical protein